MTAKTPTLSEFKRWAADVAPAARAVLMARAFAQMERERVDAYILPIFQAHGPFYVAERFRDRGRPEVIAKPGDLYLCEDEPMIAAYFEACDRAHREHGFTGPQGHCPALTAEHLLCVTERELIKLAEPLFGIEHVYGEDRAKYLKLLIGACLKAEGEQAA